VDRIEELATQIHEAGALRQEVAEHLEALWQAALRTILVGQTRAGSIVPNRSAEALLKESANRNSNARTSNHNNAHPDSPSILQFGPEPLPSGWTWTTLGSVLTHLVDCVNDTPDFADHDTGLIGLKSTNIRPYVLDLSRRWFMKKDDFDRWNRRLEPQAGDVVLTREAPMGYACLLPPGHQVCLTQRLLLLRPDAQTILPELLLHYLNSPLFRVQVDEKCRGLTTPHIRVQDAPRFALPLPPIDDQHRIVAQLGSLKLEVEALRCLQSEATSDFDALLPAILDRAFKGELL
jgi:type I restriction enzyme, S subunit